MFPEPFFSGPFVSMLATGSHDAATRMCHKTCHKQTERDWQQPPETEPPMVPFHIGFQGYWGSYHSSHSFPSPFFCHPYASVDPRGVADSANYWRDILLPMIYDRVRMRMRYKSKGGRTPGELGFQRERYMPISKAGRAGAGGEAKSTNCQVLTAFDQG